MTADSYNVFSTRDLAIMLGVCLFATVWVLRKKSPRERIALFAAAIVLITLNGVIFFVFGGPTWRERLPLYDAMFWLATLVGVIFNRMAGTGSRSDKNKHIDK